MKVAVSATGRTLDEAVDLPFGRCSTFLLVETDARPRSTSTKRTSIERSQAKSRPEPRDGVCPSSGASAMMTRSRRHR